MVEYLTGVVGDATCCLDDYVFEAVVLEDCPLNQFVQVVYIGLQMLAKMEVDGLLADGRCQCGCCIAEFGHFDYSFHRAIWFWFR